MMGGGMGGNLSGTVVGLELETEDSMDCVKI